MGQANNSNNYKQPQRPVETADSKMLELSKRFYLFLIIGFGVNIANILAYNTGAMAGLEGLFVDWFSVTNFSRFDTVWATLLVVANAAFIVFLKLLKEK